MEIVRIADRRNRSLFFTRDQFRELVYIYLMDPADRDELVTLDIFYRGRLPPAEQTTDVLAAGQFNETFILTPPKYESVLYSRASGWYPEPTDDDYFTARQKIIVPPEYTCVANGVLLERTTLDALSASSVESLDKAGHAVYLFETKRPVKYLSFIAGPFDAAAQDGGPPPLFYLVSANVFSMRKLPFSSLAEIVGFYDQLFGPYPFERLTVVHRLWPVGGGHSPASFLVVNEPPRAVDSRLPLNPSSPVDLSRWKEYFVAHEIAHQWWGQGVTGGSYRDQWVSEGLAQFGAMLYLGEKHGDRALEWILEKFCQWTDKTSHWGQISLGSRLSYLNFEAYQAIVYNKTALVLYLLKEVIGPDAFFEGLKEFYETHRYGTARTSDFRRSLEKTSGRDLRPFFQAWFDSHALPNVLLNRRIVGRGADRRLEIHARQQSEAFVFPLWVEWQEGGRRVVHRLVVEGFESSFSLPFPESAKNLKIPSRRVVPGLFKVED